MNEVRINPDKTYTKSEYSKRFGISRPTVDRMIKDKEIKVIRVKGTVLIVAN